jgi:hypothetical protein
MELYWTHDGLQDYITETPGSDNVTGIKRNKKARAKIW